MEHVRDLTLLPKAHLHLHFTGSMRPSTLLELADKYGVRLPDALTAGEPPNCGPPTNAAGSASSASTTPPAPACASPTTSMRLVREAAEEDVRDGSGWLEIQVDPTSYAPSSAG